MSDVRLPLSGDVVQSILPWTAVFNVNLGSSSDPDAEKAIIADVASYGKQLGRIGDALRVLFDAFEPKRPLDDKETKAVRALLAMLDEIDDKKEKVGTRPERSRPVSTSSR